MKINKSDSAIYYLEKAHQIGVQYNIFEGKRNSAKLLYQLYAKNKNFEKAFNYLNEFKYLQDLSFNEETQKASVQQVMKYEYEKKIAIEKADQEKKDGIAKEKNKKQKIILYAVCFLALILLVFLIFAYKNYLQKQRANLAITKQKEIIEEKQKEILDSIHYAKRIQNALLPSEKYIEKNTYRLKK